MLCHVTWSTVTTFQRSRVPPPLGCNLPDPDTMTTIYQLTHCKVLEVLKCYLSCNNIKSHIFPIIILYCVVLCITFGINILYLYSQRAYLSYNCIKIRIVNSFQSIERHKWFNTPHLVTCWTQFWDNIFNMATPVYFIRLSLQTMFI